MQRDSAYKQDSTFAESSSDSNKLNADSTQTAESQKDSTTSKQTDSANDSIISPQSPQQDSKLLGTLKIYLNSHTLTLLNYDILNSSLNIKLESNSKQAKELHQAKVKAKQQQVKEQDNILSFALLHPILEDNEIKCPHNGVVKLKSSICYNIFGLAS